MNMCALVASLGIYVHAGVPRMIYSDGFPRHVCFIGASLFHIRPRLLAPRPKHLLNNKRIGLGVRGDVLSNF